MAIDRGILDQQLQTLGDATRWWDQRELRDLPGVLRPDEKLLAIARGKIARIRVLRRSWLIVVTDKRLLCLRSGGPTRWQQIEVDADEIERVTLRVGPLRGRVRIVAGSHIYRLLVRRPDSWKLSAALSSLCAQKQEHLTGRGPVLMVRRVFDHVLSLPSVALNPAAPPRPPAAATNPATDQRLQLLEEQVQQLQQQVDFLEQLLRERQALEARLPAGELG